METQSDPLNERLADLARFDTFSALSRAFGQLMAVWAREAGGQAVPVHRLLVDFLDNELRYHAALAAMVERDSATYQDLHSIADKRRIALQVVAENAAHTRPLEGRAELVRHLLLAELHYHLHEFPQVVEELETAVATGAEHPLIYFALGYNRFIIAADLHRRLTEDRDVEEDEVHEAALSAVEAFGLGLTGHVFDAQLHFWTGQALRLAGLEEQAKASLETALGIDPGLLTRVLGASDEQLADESEQTAEEEQAQEAGDPISDEDVEEARWMFARTWKLQDLFDVSAD